LKLNLFFPSLKNTGGKKSESGNFLPDAGVNDGIA
jgi:hypothetical protein